MRTWQHLATLRLVHQHRTGWWGVWDALKAAVTGDARTVVKEPYTLEMWANVEQGPVLDAVLLIPEQKETTDAGQVETSTYIDGIAINGVALGK